MAQCESCGASALSDAQFCEACGHRLGTAAPESKKSAPAASEPSGSGNLEARPGSLRGDVAFLSGALDQAKVRLENYKNRGDKSVAKIEAERKAEQKRADREELRASAKGPIARITRFVVGVAALLMFVYMLIRLPRTRLNPLLMIQLYNELVEEFEIDTLF